MTYLTDKNYCQFPFTLLSRFWSFSRGSWWLQDQIQFACPPLQLHSDFVGGNLDVLTEKGDWTATVRLLFIIYHRLISFIIHIMNLSTTSVLLFLLSHNVAASTEDKDTSALLRGGQTSSKSNINNNQYHRELPPAWKTQGCKINGEKIGIYVGGGMYVQIIWYVHSFTFFVDMMSSCYLWCNFLQRLTYNTLQSKYILLQWTIIWEVGTSSCIFLANW